MVKWLGVLFLLTATLEGVSAMGVGIVGDQWTYDGVALNVGTPAEGVMLNFRGVQAAIHDHNSRTQGKWKYPDGAWDPERNLQEFVAQIPKYRSYGLNMVTVGMMGGHPRFKCADDGGIGGRDFSMFNKDGTLRGADVDRLARLITAAEEHELIINVQLFYRTANSFFPNDTAIIRATKEAAEFLRDLNAGNVVVEIVNESNTKFKREAIRPMNLYRRIEDVKQIWPGALVTATLSGGNLGPASLKNAEDWVAFHGNSLNLDQTRKRIQEAKKLGKPVVINEDHWDAGKTLEMAVGEGAGWGFYEQGCEKEGNYTGAARYRDGFQSPPVNWSPTSNPTKKAFFEKIAELSAGVTPQPEPEPVGDFTLTFAINNSDVHLAWTDAEADWYVVKESDTGVVGEFTVIEKVPASTLSYVVQGVTDGDHYYRVLAVYDLGTSKERKGSNIVKVTVGVEVPPEPEPAPEPVLQAGDPVPVEVPGEAQRVTTYAQLREALDDGVRVLDLLGEFVVADMKGLLVPSNAKLYINSESDIVPAHKDIGAAFNCRQGNQEPNTSILITGYDGLFTLHGFYGFLDRKGKPTGRGIIAGQQSLIQNFNIYDCAENGIGGGSVHGTRALHGILRRNGSPETLGHAAAGLKWANCDSTEVSYVLAEANWGNGLWWDVGAKSMYCHHSIMRANSRKGTHYEISYGPALYEDCLAEENGWQENRERSDGGYVIVSSQNVTYRRCTSSHNVAGAGFRIKEDDRPPQVSNIDIEESCQTLNGDQIVRSF